MWRLCRFYGVMAVYATPDLAFGSVISGFMYSFWNLFAGFLIGVNVSASSPFCAIALRLQTGQRPPKIYLI